jgi:hypothetical protein
MRPLELIKTLAKRQLTPQLALEALRHQAYVQIYADTLLIQIKKDLDFVGEDRPLQYKITRRGKELVAEAEKKLVKKKQDSESEDS